MIYQDVISRRRQTRLRLITFIQENEKPNYYRYLGFYPAYAAVSASKVQLEAMEKQDNPHYTGK